MILQRSDYDQAARYLEYACEILEREAFGRTATVWDVLQIAVRRLSPEDHFVGEAAAEITVLPLMAACSRGGLTFGSPAKLCAL
jgi:hypothetical protein